MSSDPEPRFQYRLSSLLWGAFWFCVYCGVPGMLSLLVWFLATLAPAVVLLVGLIALQIPFWLFLRNKRP